MRWDRPFIAVVVAIVALGSVFVSLWALLGSYNRAASTADAVPVQESSVRPDNPDEWPAASDSIAGTAWTNQDWEILQETIRMADARGFDTLPLGEAVAEMGKLFLGTPYVPQTLEVPGPERLVVNLRALDCVTFVENVLALTRFQRRGGGEALADPAAAREMYEANLRQMRYRDGMVTGYASRLHYFSEWIDQGVVDGRLRGVAGDLGGVEDPEPIGFMSAHQDAYRQMADPGVPQAIAEVERRLAGNPPRVFIPEDRIAAAASGIQTGDVIAATSTLEGLDVAHTGIAVWLDGELHLLHAPLVGSTVVLSERPLAQRILDIGSQDGILVARPLTDWFTH